MKGQEADEVITTHLAPGKRGGDEEEIPKPFPIDNINVRQTFSFSSLETHFVHCCIENNFVNNTTTYLIARHLRVQVLRRPSIAISS